MLLAIDAGNTNIVFALIKGEEIVRKWRIATHGERTADEYMVWISQLMKLAEVSVKDVTGAIIATVVPQTQHPLTLLCRRYFGCEPLVVGEPAVTLGIDIRIDAPREVGADRLVNAVAAHDRVGEACIVIDFGTATTFDVVADNGDYLGGVISPGINLSIDALYEAAAKLPRIAVEEPPDLRVIGRNTLEAMQSGVFWGYIGLIEGIVARIRKERKNDGLKVLATGGLAKVFFGKTDAIQVVDHDLTIHGLRLIFDRNTETQPNGG